MTNFQATLVNVGYGQLALKDSLGRISQKWTLSNPKCVIGTGTNCNVSCNLPGIADHHALLVIGARQVFLRAMAPGLTRCGENVSELVIPSAESEFGFEIAGHHFVYSRIASSQPLAKEFVSESMPSATQRYDQIAAATSASKPSAPTVAPAAAVHPSAALSGSSPERLRFTFVRALEKSRSNHLSDSSLVDASQSGERPAWVEAIVRDALRPVESRLDDLSAPLNNIQRRMRRDARQRKLRRQARQTAPKVAKQPVVPPELLKSQGNIEKLVSQTTSRLDQIGQNVSQLVTRLSDVDQRLNSTRQGHEDLTQKSIQSNLEITKLQQEMLSLFRQLQTQLEQPSTSDQQHLWQSSVEAQLAELQSSMLALDDIRLTLETAIAQTASLKNEFQLQRDANEKLAANQNHSAPSLAELNASINETITRCLNQEFTDSIQASIRKSILGPMTQEVTDSLSANLTSHLAALTAQLGGMDSRLSGVSSELSNTIANLLQNRPEQPSSEPFSTEQAAQQISAALHDTLLTSLSQSLPSVLAQALTQSLPQPISQAVMPGMTAALSESLSISLANTVSQSIAQSLSSMPMQSMPAQSMPAQSMPMLATPSMPMPEMPVQSTPLVQSSPAAAIPSAIFAATELGGYANEYAAPAATAQPANVQQYDHLAPSSLSLPAINDSQPVIELEPVDDQPVYYSDMSRPADPISEGRAEPSSLSEAAPPESTNSEAAESFSVEEPLRSELPSWWTDGPSDSRPLYDSQAAANDAQTPAQPSWPGQNYFERNYFQSSLEQESPTAEPNAYRNIDDHVPQPDGYLPSAFSAEQLEIERVQADALHDQNQYPSVALPEVAEAAEAPTYNPYQLTGYEPMAEIENPYAQFERPSAAYSNDQVESAYAPIEEVPQDNDYAGSDYLQPNLPPAYEALPERPTQSVPASDNPTVRASEATSGNGEDGDESVEDYMRRLLARMRGVSESEITLPGGEQNKAPAQVAPKDPSAPKNPVASEKAAGPEPISEDWTEPFDPDKYVPRGAAPEKNKDLNALRELANNSARSAIQVSARRRQGSAILIKSAIALVGFIAGVALVSINGARINIAFIATVASFLVAIIWGYDCLTSIRPLLQAGRAPKDPTPPPAM